MLELDAGGHMFEKGVFTLASRATNLAYKVGQLLSMAPTFPA